ncbi:formin-like protein 4, partial [Papaver somniferum]|uniref:formin-like protein 4 n=1 Tax=Papaver somniferum TaxID=3469 RepID=UPI000E6FA245
SSLSWQLPCLFISLLFVSLIHFSSCQSNSPQNLETFFPSIPLSPPFVPPTRPSPDPVTVFPVPPEPRSSHSTGKTVGKAVGITAASTIVVAGLFFFFLQRYVIANRKKKNEDQKTDTNTTNGMVFHRDPLQRDNVRMTKEEMKRFDGTLKGIVVDEDGLDVLYWRKLEGGTLPSSFKKEVLSKINDINEDDVRKERRKERRNRRTHSRNTVSPWKFDFITSSTPPPPPPPPPSTLPPPPPSAAKKVSAAPPPPSTLPKIATKEASAPPPPPPKFSKPPPPPPKGKSAKPTSAEFSSESSAEGSGKAKLKPLHWDKVTANPDHSMVWDKISGGSFRFDDDLMEALFGNVATKKSPKGNPTKSSMAVGGANPYSPTQVFLLDPRKSQNIAIVLRSLAISRTEILDALQEGRGLDSDTLEKLAKFAPTEEEEAALVEFDGNITKLADAESFLYHIFKAVRYPFARLDAMLFRLNYEPEILQLKNSLKILEAGCNELRTRGLFLKLLEAILKAGNRMNAGTARGNAKAFNLTALRKLSDVKSSDGKTTLLHFVVEEVVRFEGKRCVLNKNNNFSRSNSRGGTSSGAFSGGLNADPSLSKEDREKEYMMLGLPIVGGLSTEVANVKKAATIDYEGFGNICTTLTKRVTETRKFAAKIEAERSGFVKEMKSFLDSSDEELKAMKEEQERIMNLVKRTTQYYQAGTKDKDHPLQLFVTVHDFLRMVDQVCLDIARNVQKKKPAEPTAAAAGSSTSSSSPPKRAPVRFPYLPVNILSDKSKSSSSGGDSSDDGF